MNVWHRVGWVFALGLSAVVSSAPAEAAADLVEERDVASLQADLQAGRLSSETLVRAYLQRIETIDRHGPTLNAIIELNPEALAIARAMDAERAQGKRRSPLHGIPVLLKDNIDTADSMQTSAGSLALVGQPALRDAELVARLRAAGMVILGKTNLSEWANFRGKRSSAGWSSRGGQTRNPYALDRSPCGSSSGSAVAVAASLVSVAVGTETDGSIVCPAAMNGVVGIKPTVGLVSRSGIVPISSSQDTAGALARNVRDAALLLQVMTGSDPRDPITADADAHQVSLVDALSVDALRGARIGVVRQLTGYHPDVDARFEAALQVMRDAGAILVDDLSFPTRAEANTLESTLFLHEFKSGLDAYLDHRQGVPIASLEELIAYNQRHAAQVMPWFGQEYLEQAAATHGIGDLDYQNARQRLRQLTREQGIDALLTEHRLDALIAPTTGPAWKTDWLNGGNYLGGSAGMAAMAGYPNISLPMGQVHGLPVGLSIFGTAWSEARLIALAYAFEQRAHARKPPRYAVTLP
ncbi:MAG TPA: amidase [Aquimonas sp.]|nr:amidase [Xanthomonadales bacterium]HRF54163.1 amidase [Aquimonas sp.]